MKEDLKNIIKRTVDNHSDDINPDMIWAGIESKLADKKKKRFGGYWIFGSLSLFTAVLIFGLAWSSRTSIDESSIANYANDLRVNEEDVIGKEVENKNESNETVGNEKDEQLVLDKAEISKTEDRTIFSQEVESNSKNKIVASENIVNEENLSNTSGLDQNRLLAVSRNDRVEINEVENNRTGRNEVEGNRHSTTLDEKIDRELIFVNRAKFLKSDQFLIQDRDVKLGAFEEFVFDAPSVANESKFSFLSGVELYSGVSFGDKSVSDVDQSYADIRNSSEQLLEQWNAGLRIDLVKVMDFQLQSGVRYSMITDRMELENEYVDLPSFTYMKSRLVNGEIVVIDSMLVVVDTLNQKLEYTTQQYNSQRVISIPLEISFGKSFDKFDLGLGFGVDINYQLADTHVILDQDNKSSVNKVGGKWVSPSFSGSLLAGYKLTDSWSVTTRLNFRGLSLSDHESISTLKSNYKLYGIELGIKRNFGN